MVRLCGLLCVVLLVPSVGAADTMVTWTSEGAVTFSHWNNELNTGLVPPPGTPYQLSMSFDPGTAFPTMESSPGSNCFTVAASGSLNLGGAQYALSGFGYTHGQLPGLLCNPSRDQTQFLFFPPVPEDNPWPGIAGPLIMELWYTDLLVRDAFPLVPTTTQLDFQLRSPGFGGPGFLVLASGNLQAEEQPAPVPEPATMTLVGLGLAAAIRRARRLRTQLDPN